MTKVKICGIQIPVEAEYLNCNEVDYAGIVLYEKSKRYVLINKTKEILEKLNQNITKVAVAVSQEETMMQKVLRAGFDVILLDAENYGSGQTFGWDSEDAGRQIKQTMTQAESTKSQIEMLQNFRETLKAHGILFVLAGGLCADNVREGIRIFEPDIVDVSSGVENEHGKDEEKIRIFIKKTKS